jgi:molybdopterin converting factor small subunit
MQTVEIELFGMPRVVAGTRMIKVSARTIGDALEALIESAPALRSHIANAEDDGLNAGYTFVVDGSFTSNLDFSISPESEILLVSRASGG